MILGPFLNNRPLIVFILIPIIIGYQVLNSYLNFHAQFPEINFGMWGKFGYSNTLLYNIISSVIVFLNALQLNVLFNRHEFLYKNNYAPSLFYVVLMSFSHAFYQPDAVLVVHILMLQVLRQLFKFESNDHQYNIYFNIGFLIGLCTTFIPISSILFFPILMAIWVLQPITFRTFLILTIGFITPVINGLAFWWYSGHKINTHLLKHNTFINYETLFYFGLTSIIIILLLLSIIGIQIRLRKSNIRFKKLNRVMVWFMFGTLLLGVLGVFFFNQNESLSLLFIPLSFFYTYAFIHTLWMKVATIFFYITLLVSVFEYFVPLFLK